MSEKRGTIHTIQYNYYSDNILQVVQYRLREGDTIVVRDMASRERVRRLVAEYHGYDFLYFIEVQCGKRR